MGQTLAAAIEVQDGYLYSEHDIDRCHFEANDPSHQRYDLCALQSLTAQCGARIAGELVKALIRKLDALEIVRNCATFRCQGFIIRRLQRLGACRRVKTDTQWSKNVHQRVSGGAAGADVLWHCGAGAAEFGVFADRNSARSGPAERCVELSWFRLQHRRMVVGFVVCHLLLQPDHPVREHDPWSQGVNRFAGAAIAAAGGR